MIRTRTPTHAAEIVLIGVMVLEGLLALGGSIALLSFVPSVRRRHRVRRG